MVEISIVTMVYKPTNITRGYHIVGKLGKEAEIHRKHWRPDVFLMGYIMGQSSIGRGNNETSRPDDTAVYIVWIMTGPESIARLVNIT